MKKLVRIVDVSYLTAAFLSTISILIIYLVVGGERIRFWPCFKFALSMSVITCLWAFANKVWILIDKSRKEGMSGLEFGFLVVPFEFLLFNPYLGLDLGEKNIWLLGFFMVIQGGGFALLNWQLSEMIKDAS